jgi:hypothetical protein
VTRLVVLALVLLACAPEPSDPPPTGDPLAAYSRDAMLDGWEAAGFPYPPERCHVDMFAIERPTDEDAHHRLCPRGSNACFRWQRVPSPAPTFKDPTVLRPVAVIHPIFEGPVVARLAVHEGYHGLCQCALGHWDADIWHTRPDVWHHPGTPVDAAEEYARESLAAGSGP